MWWCLRSLIFLLSVFPLSAAHGEGDAVYIYIDGNTLLGSMNGPTDQANMALGYVLGATDALTATQGGQFTPICLPARAVQQQTRDIVKKWLTDHPEARHRGAASLVHSALIEAYPCAPEVASPPTKDKKK